MQPRLIASGEQVELASGETRLVAVTMGGGLRELAHGGRPVLDGYGPDEVPVGAYGQPLIPWPNRLADGRYEFEGVAYQVPLTEPDKRNALHGFARWLTWRVEDRSPSRATLALDMYPRSGYPFALQLRTTYSVTDARVQVATVAVNAGTSRLPYAQGFHPYVTAGAPTIDECTLCLRAAQFYPTDERQLPTGRASVAGTDYDFRAPRTIGATRLDLAYTELERDPDGLARIELRAPDGRRVAVWMDAAYRYVMAFTGDTLGDAARRRRSLGVEPMTAAPNAFRSGDGLLVLEPGERFECSWGLEIG